MFSKKLKSKKVLSAVLSLVLLFSYPSFTNAAESAIKRLYGNDSIETSIKIAQELKSTTNTYVLATNDDYPDALAGTILASKYNAPILFTSKDDNSKLYDYLKSANVNKGTKFYILGGTGVITQSVEDYLKGISNNIERLGGDNRYETCKLIDENLGVKLGTPVIITTGENYPDALSIGAIGGQLQYPILLSNKDSIPDIIIQELQNIKPSTVYIAGGTGVISSKVEQQIKSLISPKTVRFAGSDRYDTSIKIADYFKDNISNDVYATGSDFHDSLAAVPLAVENKGSIILVDNNNYRNQLSVSKHKGYIIGSLTTLSSSIENYITGKNITPSLTILTDAIYDSPINFSEGLAVVHNDNGYSYIDTNGKVKIGPIRSKIFKISDGTGGTISTEEEVRGASSFHEGIAFLSDNDGICNSIAIDNNGNEIFQSEDAAGDMQLSSFMDGISVAIMPGVAEFNNYLVDKTGKAKELDMNTITKNDYNRVDEYAEGLLSYLTQNENKFGYVDINNKEVVIKPQFEDCRKFNNGIAPVKMNGVWGFINKEGKYLINPQYQDFAVNDKDYSYRVFINDIASVKKNGKWGAINKNGKVVIDFKYDSGFIFNNGIAYVKENNKYVYIDTKGNEINKAKYDDANIFNNNIALVGNNGVYSLIDKNNSRISNETWNFQGSSVNINTPDIVSYEKNGKWGIARITY